MTTSPPRRADHPIDPLFLERWSPRAFTGEAVPEADLLSMFEAARWAPSSYNSQPWRFLYARRDTERWPALFDLISPSNQRWVKDTGALVVLVSSALMRVKEELVRSYSHSLDAGAASALFQLQAIRLGWHAHGMSGFDKERAVGVLNVPPDHRVEAAYAVGRRADPATLTDEQRAREVPNGRRPITDFAFEGGFPPREG